MPESDLVEKLRRAESGVVLPFWHHAGKLRLPWPIRMLLDVRRRVSVRGCPNGCRTGCNTPPT